MKRLIKAIGLTTLLAAGSALAASGTTHLGGPSAGSGTAGSAFSGSTAITPGGNRAENGRLLVSPGDEYNPNQIGTHIKQRTQPVEYPSGQGQYVAPACPTVK